MVRRADLLPHLDQEFGVEAELAASRLADRAERCEIDRVLAFIVGGATPIDAVTDRGCLPRIEPVAPLAFHTGNYIAMALDQYGRQLCVLAMLGDEERRFAAGRLHQPALEVQLGEGRPHLLFQ